MEVILWVVGSYWSKDMERACFFVLCIFLIVGAVHGARRSARYNSQIKFEFGLGISDVDGDLVDDFYKVQSDRAYVHSSGFWANGLYVVKFDGPVNRIFTGRFFGDNKNLMCAQIVSSTFSAINCRMANGLLMYAHFQDDFIGTSDIIVGDFNADGKDDVLLYNSTTGLFTCYEMFMGSRYNEFQPMTNWVPGDLNAIPRPGMQVRAGNIGLSKDGITDLILFNVADGNSWVYFGAFLGSGKYTQMFVFQSGNATLSGLEIGIADADGDLIDEIVFHNFYTGDYFFYRLDLVFDIAVKYVLKPILVNQGQLYKGPYNRVFWRKVRAPPPTEDGGRTLYRDDAVVFSHYYYPYMWIRTDAYIDGSGQTYLWVYTQNVIELDQDQDGDAILTKHELGGYDQDNNGVSDTPLHLYGASPFYKDIFVEVDYMAGPPGANWNFSMSPEAASLASYWMLQKGINLHIFRGDQIPYQQNLGNPKLDWNRDVKPIEAANFAPSREHFFHWCLFACRYDGDTSTGVAIIGGNDFIVSLGDRGSTQSQVGTFLHELGHNLGLGHGGVDGINSKPNHLSVMNYDYQFVGIKKNGQQGAFLYNELDCATLDEKLLDEQKGISCTGTGSNTYEAIVKVAGRPDRWARVNQAFDFDYNGQIATASYFDINHDGVNNGTLIGTNEYSIMKFDSGPIGHFGAKRDISQEPIREPHQHETPNRATLDFSHLNLARHDGIQFPGEPLKNYPDIFPDASHALVGPSAEEVARFQLRQRAHPFQP